MRNARGSEGEERPADVIGNVGSDATISNARLIAVFDAALAAVAGLLIWRSLSWPLIGDATIFQSFHDKAVPGQADGRAGTQAISARPTPMTFQCDFIRSSAV